MTADERVPGDRNSFHRLPESAFEALARGDGDGHVAEQLLNVERSRRLVLLRALLDQADGYPGVVEAWSLLERAQSRAPEAVDDVLMAPGTGMWLSSALRQLRGREPGAAPPWVTCGHLSALAAAAATRAGFDFSVSVPMRSGFVPLPTLGCAVLATAEEWSTAEVTVRDGHLSVTGDQQRVQVGPDWDSRTADWLPTRRTTTGPVGRELAVVLEESDPYRTYLTTSPPRFLSEAEAAEWNELLAEAWKALLRDEPVAADAMRRALLSITPCGPRERHRPYSSSAGDAFGGLNASLPHGSSHLAATLVHEFQHIKLGALLHLVPLLRPHGQDQGERPELFHAPWRDDPRPLEGLLQGIYAFFGVARFWRTHRHTVDPAQAPQAHFEYVFWREQVRSTLETVRDHERLTTAGRRVLARLGDRCAAWDADEVPSEVLRLARETAADHAARWSEHHMRPPSAAVNDAARAWRRGDPRPPSSLGAEPAVVPARNVGFLDVAAVLARHTLGGPDHTGRYGAEGEVRGAGEADVLLARGKRAEAVRFLVPRLRSGDAPVGSWAVLGRALADDPAHDAASRLLRRFPERVRAVQDVLREEGPEAADPLELADWLGAAAETQPA